MDRPLLFSDLWPAPTGVYMGTIPPELRTELERRTDLRVRHFTENSAEPPEDFPPLEVVSFVVDGERPADRHGIVLLLDDLHGTPEDNVASIQRTAPDGWSVRVREGTL